MAANAENMLSTLEKNFILKSAIQNQRIDGRSLHTMRPISINCTRAAGNATAEVQLGSTRVCAIISAEIVPPFPDRPMEGFLKFNVEFSPMGAPQFEAGRPSAEAIEVTRIVERLMRDARALDTEALCIVSGEKVWSLRCDVHVLDHGGNLVDASALATIAGLMHFRRADVTVQGETVTIHSYEERAPVPLSLHHIPVCITFGIFSEHQFEKIVSGLGINKLEDVEDQQEQKKDNDVLIVDPTYQEEAVMQGTVTFALNAHEELCCVHKLGGAPLSPERFLKFVSHAAKIAKSVIDQLKTTMKEADEAEKIKARERHAIAAGYTNVVETNKTESRTVNDVLGLSEVSNENINNVKQFLTKSEAKFSMPTSNQRVIQTDTLDQQTSDLATSDTNMSSDEEVTMLNPED